MAGMVGPSQAELEFVRNEDGTVLFTFLVTEEGEYKLNLKFLHYQLPGILGGLLIRSVCN